MNEALEPHQAEKIEVETFSFFYFENRSGV